MDTVQQRILESIQVKQRMMQNTEFTGGVRKAADMITCCLKNGGKLVLAGNGGSESDALHFAGEITGRFLKERDPWPALVLGADPATMTAIANDYGYEETYARQAKAFVKKGDVFIGISTSGNSINVIRAMEAVYGTGCKMIALLGRDGGRMKAMAHQALVIPSDVTARIQESHITVIHILCELVEEAMNGAERTGKNGYEEQEESEVL